MPELDEFAATRFLRAKEQQDAATVGQNAHSLKSSGANVGTVQGATLSKELEILGKSAQLTNASHTLTAIQTAVELVTPTLLQELSPTSSNSTPPRTEA